MAIIKKPQLLIQRRIEERQIKQEFRPHLGGSIIGKECRREIWYSFRWAKQKVIDARTERLFNRGHAEEIVVIEDLINAGCKVTGINIDRSIENRFETIFGHKLPKFKQKSASFAFGFGGASTDGEVTNLPDAPKTPHLLEVKTSNTKKFVTMKNQGVKRANKQHYTQMQIYMHVFGYKRALYIMVCKETDERHYERVRHDKQTALEAIKKAEYIITTKNPPHGTSMNVDIPPCKWCDYLDICIGREMPDKNCRTCNHICFVEEDRQIMAHVECLRTGKKRSLDKQKKGCKKYEPNRLW